MSYFEALGVIILLVWVVSRIEVRSAAVREKEQELARTESTVKTPSPAPKPARIIKIEGAKRFTPKTGLGFVKAFSLQPERVTDVAKLEGPQRFGNLSPALQQILHRMQEQGCLHGLEVMKFLFHEGSLDAEESLYFALVEHPSSPPYVVGFIDKAGR